MTPNKEIDDDDLKLRELGFNPEASPSEALAIVRKLRASGSAPGAAIARALGEVNDHGAAVTLVEMEAGASGALRREIRRSLYRLRQRGIAAPEPARAVAPAAVPNDPGFSALMSPVDREGAQIIWLIKPRPRGGVMRLWGLISEKEGLVGAQALNLTRRELRGQREDLERQAGMKLVAAEPRFADFLLSEAYRNTPENRRAPVGNFLALRSEITATAAPTEIAHPIYRELPPQSAAEPSPELLKEPEIQEYRFSPEELEPYAEEVNRAQESVLVVSRASQEERIVGAVDRAITELLGGKCAERVLRRFENTAYYLLRSGRREAAQWAAAAAAKIRDGADLKKIPFFRTLVQEQLAALIAQEAEHKAEEPRLIMTPAEAIRARQERQSRSRVPHR